MLFYRANIAKKKHLCLNINEKKKEKTAKVVRNSTYMYRELANLCENLKPATIIQYTIKGRFMSR